MKSCHTSFAGFLLIAFLAIPAYAADITVDAVCSLADAITAANSDEAVGGCSAGQGADKITLTADVKLTRALPLVTSNIRIEGAGFSVQGNRRTHIMGVKSSGTLAINDIRLRAGRSGWGGAIGNLKGKLTITNAVIADNSADEGGAIGNEGTLKIVDSVIRDNSADGSGGAIYNLGGNVTIENSTFQKNSSGNRGGAIHNDDGFVTISDASVFDSNRASGSGGAIYNDEGTTQVRLTSFISNSAGERYSPSGGAIYNFINYDDDEDELTIESSTFLNNAASENGGAIYNCCGNLSIANSTFVGNTAGESGGALYNSNDYDVTTVRFSTFHGNSAEEDGGGIYLERGNADVNIVGTIIADNKYGDCFGRLNANVQNMTGDGSCFAEFSGDPTLGDLIKPEDGSPPYLRPLAGSPVIDSTSRIRCNRTTDQIGTARPQGEACDIGAIEYVSEE